jgi:hypothetical protein
MDLYGPYDNRIDEIDRAFHKHIDKQKLQQIKLDAVAHYKKK